jgi:hypothetical protein
LHATKTLYPPGILTTILPYPFVLPSYEVNHKNRLNNSLLAAVTTSAMATKIFGSAHGRASMPIDDDQVSILSTPEHRQSQYQPYRPVLLRNSSSQSSTLEHASSRVASQMNLQDLQPATSLQQTAARPLGSPLPRMVSSLFGDGAVLGTPYQESVPWANSTNFRSTVQDPPKALVWETAFVVTNENTPQKSSRRYFRNPRHIPTPWKTGFWLRFPWWGAGALLIILMCKSTCSVSKPDN